MTNDRERVVAEAKAERRRHRRVRVDLAGRLFVPAEEREAQCRITDLSPGGAQVASDIVPAADSQIVLYIDGFGRLEGVVARPRADAADAADKPGNAFGVRFVCTPMKRERIAEQLILLMNKGAIDESAMRRHDREPTRGLARFTRSNGDVVACEVMDLSLSGVSLKTEIRPPLGEVVLIGQMAGRIVRHHESGIAVEFVGAPAAPTIERPAAKLSVVR
ncbi:MAG TPA: PilZ domain-containing protein [Rhizomicrobium sp.]|nr:PilZ domain-containing protein [Rhizomicrobium sp.]